MRRFRTLIICLGALNLAACNSTAPDSGSPPADSDLSAENLLRDPGFEDDTTAWERILGPQLGRFVATERVHSGAHSLAIQASSEIKAVVFQTVSIEGGAEYEAGGWLLTESAGGGGASILLQWIDERSVVVAEETIDVLFGTNFWTEMALATRAPSGAETVRFVLQLSADPDGFGGAWFDDLSLRQVGPPLATDGNASGSADDIAQSGADGSCIDCSDQSCDSPGGCAVSGAPQAVCATDADCASGESCRQGRCQADASSGGGSEDEASDFEPIISGRNLLADPGFELGGIPWQRVSSGNIESEVVHSGSWALEVPVSRSRIQSIHQDVPALSSGEYQISGWLRADGAGGGALLLVQWLNESGGVISAAVIGSGSDSTVWRLVSATVTAPTGTATARVTLRVMADQDGVGSAFFDDEAIVLLDAPGLCESDVECDDGNFCNGVERCLGNLCRAATPLICNDLNPCTDDMCDPSRGCVSVIDDSNSCNDGLACNGPDHCAEGMCVSAEPEGCTATGECVGELCENPDENNGESGGEGGGQSGGGETGGGGEGGSDGGGTGGEVGPNTGGSGTIFVDVDALQLPGYDPALPYGSADRPFSSLQSAANVVSAGDTVYIRGGVYYAPDGAFTTPVLAIDRGGSAGAPVRFESYQNEKVILDAQAVFSSGNNGHRRGIFIDSVASYVEISGLVVRNAYREGIYVRGDHVTIEDCIVEHCGLNATNSESSAIKFVSASDFVVRRCAARNCYSGIVCKSHASDGLIIDCLSYENGFLPGGTPIFPENADGISTSAARDGSDRVRIVGCVALANGDDQIDLSHSRDCSAEGCIALYGNAQNGAGGDGNGFKVGNDQNEAVGSGRECRRLLVRYCIAIGNRANGIDARDGIDGVFYNNTAYGNHGQFGMSTGTPGHVASFYNDLSWGNDQQDLFVGDDAKIADYNNWADAAGRMVPGGDQHSIRANPGFANPGAAIDTSWQQYASDDVRGIVPTLSHIRDQVAANFALTNTDPSTTSIDRGAFIARTTSTAVQTTQINVNRDPRRVFRNGDTIRLESGATAIIQSMTSSRITVDRNISFPSGAGVHLNFSGSAPDLGAGGG